MKILNRKRTTSWREYQKLFSDSLAGEMKGDVSPDYLFYYKESIGNILKYLDKNVRIVISLRSPAERAFSHFMHHYKSGVALDRNFRGAIDNEERRINEGWPWNYLYRQIGLYSDAVTAYKNSFTYVKVLIFDEFMGDITGRLKELYSFLGVDSGFPAQIRRHNESYTPYSIKGDFLLKKIKGATKKNLQEKKIRHGVIDQLIRLNRRKNPQIDDDVKKELQSFYSEDIHKLENVLNRSLEAWSD